MGPVAEAIAEEDPHRMGLQKGLIRVNDESRPGGEIKMPISTGQMRRVRDRRQRLQDGPVKRHPMLQGLQAAAIEPRLFALQPLDRLLAWE
jgi:hypothetical protein